MHHRVKNSAVCKVCKRQLLAEETLSVIRRILGKHVRAALSLWPVPILKWKSRIRFMAEFAVV